MRNGQAAVRTHLRRHRLRHRHHQGADHQGKARGAVARLEPRSGNAGDPHRRSGEPRGHLPGPVGDFVQNNPSVRVLALAFLVLIGAVLVMEATGHHVAKGYIYSAIAFSPISVAIS